MLKRFCIYLLLGIGIFLSVVNPTYAACNKTINADKPSANLYTCSSEDTFDNTGGHTLTKSGTIISTVNNSAADVIILNSGTIRGNGTDTQVIKGARSSGLKVYNNA